MKWGDVRSWWSSDGSRGPGGKFDAARVGKI